METSQCIKTIEINQHTISYSVFSPSGKHMAVMASRLPGRAGPLRVYQIDTRFSLVHQDDTTSKEVEFDSRQPYSLLYAADSVIKVWNSGQIARLIDNHEQLYNCNYYHTADGTRYLATISTTHVFKVSMPIIPRMPMHTTISCGTCTQARTLLLISSQGQCIKWCCCQHTNHQSSSAAIHHSTSSISYNKHIYATRSQNYPLACHTQLQPTVRNTTR